MRKLVGTGQAGEEVHPLWNWAVHQILKGHSFVARRTHNSLHIGRHARLFLYAYDGTGHDMRPHAAPRRARAWTKMRRVEPTVLPASPGRRALRASPSINHSTCSPLFEPRVCSSCSVEARPPSRRSHLPSPTFPVPQGPFCAARPGRAAHSDVGQPLAAPAAFPSPPPSSFPVPRGCRVRGGPGRRATIRRRRHRLTRGSHPLARP